MASPVIASPGSKNIAPFLEMDGPVISITEERVLNTLDNPVKADAAEKNDPDI
jgi:hypothetical protein